MTKLAGHGTSPLEIRAEVKKRRGNDVSIDQEQSDQETAHPAVAVQEWMDRLELRVRQRRVDQRQQVHVMQKLLPIAETLHQLRGRRRHVGGVIRYASRRTGPVLAAPELARRDRVAASPRTPLIRRSCISLTRRSDRGSVVRRSIPYSRAVT